jgi:hypothetical protein
VEHPLAGGKHVLCEAAGDLVVEVDDGRRHRQRGSAAEASCTAITADKIAGAW